MDFSANELNINLIQIAFKNQLENTRNILCAICDSPTIVEFHLQNICDDCIDKIDNLDECL